MYKKMSPSNVFSNFLSNFPKGSRVTRSPLVPYAFISTLLVSTLTICSIASVGSLGSIAYGSNHSCSTIYQGIPSPRYTPYGAPIPVPRFLGKRPIPYTLPSHNHNIYNPYNPYNTYHNQFTFASFVYQPFQAHVADQFFFTGPPSIVNYSPIAAPHTGNLGSTGAAGAVGGVGNVSPPVSSLSGSAPSPTGIGVGATSGSSIHGPPALDSGNPHVLEDDIFKRDAAAINGATKATSPKGDRARAPSTILETLAQDLRICARCHTAPTGKGDVILYVRGNSSSGAGGKGSNRGNGVRGDNDTFLPGDSSAGNLVLRPNVSWAEIYNAVTNSTQPMPPAPNPKLSGDVIERIRDLASKR